MTLSPDSAHAVAVGRRPAGFVLSTLVALSSLIVPAALASETISLNGPWLRTPAGQSAELVDVPICFDPLGGITTYERRFTLNQDLTGRVVVLHFDGVAGQAKIKLNGTTLGTHGSFTPFWFDVTNLLRGPDVENVLIVELDDFRDATTVPYEDIPWVQSCGIIRDVSLRIATGASILRAGVQYTFADDQYSSVFGEVTIDLCGRPNQQVDLGGTLLDGPPDKLVTVASLAAVGVTLDAQGRGSARLEFGVSAPNLWSPDDPHMYTLWVVAVVAGDAVDQLGQRTGFRDIAVRDNDIVLNGKPVFLRGICRHDIYGPAGFVGTTDQMTTDMVRIKQAGANYVRLLHYPQHPYILSLADELGLLVSEEIPAWANFWDPAVRTQLYKMYREMILRDMNHPSIIMWLSGNARARPMPYSLEAQQLAKSLDRNRLASYVIDNDEYDPDAINADVEFVKEAGLDVYLKVTFWLYYLEFLQDAWTNFPKDLPIVIAELGFEGDDRGPVVVSPTDGEFFVSEAQQAAALTEQLEGWRPHLPFYSEEHITGMSIYNWQDLRWPNIGRYLPNHIPELRFGLVYEDREAKESLSAVSDFYNSLPDHFVGSQLDAEAPIEWIFTDARNLSDAVNTINRDAGGTLNAAGTRLYFASDGPDYVALPKLMVADLVDGAWQPARLLDIPQETEFFAFRRAPAISYDERTLYFTRAILSGIFVAQTRIWRSDFIEGRWSQPVDLGEPVNYPDPITVTSDPSITLDGGTMYFSSDRPGGFGGTDIWVTQLVGGEWQEPLNLGPVVNSASNDSEPSIAPDGRTLYFASGRPGGFGSTDIWVTHLNDGAWSPPANLGPDVNSTGSDREPEVAKDGRYLVFTGIRNGGKGLSDLWYARLPDATDITDLSDVVELQVSSNLAGVGFAIFPSDIDDRGYEASSDVITRRYRAGASVGLTVPPIFNGLRFWHWIIDGETLEDGRNGTLVSMDEPHTALAEYVIPVGLSIDGASVLKPALSAAATQPHAYTATVEYLDGTRQAVRGGVHWYVDDESVATIDPISGELTPIRGSGTVTVFVEADVAGFKLPAATKTVSLEGDSLGGLEACGALCGPLGLTPLACTFAGVWLLRHRTRHTLRRR